MRAVLFSALLLLAGQLPATAAADADQWQAALADWQLVLTRRVDDQGRVDFAGAATDRAALDRFVAFVGSHGPRATPEFFPGREAALAFHLNAYNALAMAGVLDAGIPQDFSSLLKRARFFKFRAVQVDGKKTSLYDYEKDVIRPLGEPRVHFALNCMVRACPRLPREAFRVATLDAQLESAAREFFAKPLHLRVIDRDREVRVSEILDFYTEDFAPSGRPQDLLPYINRYREVAVPLDFRVRYIPYDWTLNGQPALAPRPAR